MSIEQIPTKIEDHEEQAIAALAYVFRTKPKMVQLFGSFIRGLQNLENAIHPFYNQIWYDTAIGAQLDLIGKIVGVARRGRNDSEYRLAILAKIAINTSKGTPENAIEIYKLLTGATSVHIFEYYPGHVEIYGNVNIEYELIGDGEDAFAFDGGVDGLGFGDVFDSSIGGTFAELDLFDLTIIYSIMDSILPAGVRLDYLGYYSVDSEFAFSFEGDPNGRGFGDVFDSTVGGGFARIVPPPA